MTPEQRIAKLEAIVAELMKSDRMTIGRTLQMMDGKNIQLGLTTGTKIGTSTSQKLGFFGVTPVSQYDFSFNASADATYSNTEQNMLNGIQAALISYGLIHA